MPKVKFTKRIDDPKAGFHGVYSAGYFTVRKGDVVVMTEKMAKQINRDHKGLIVTVDAKALPDEDKVAEVVERAPRPKEDGDPEDPDANPTAAPRGLDRMFRGGHTK